MPEKNLGRFYRAPLNFLRVLIKGKSIELNIVQMSTSLMGAAVFINFLNMFALADLNFVHTLGTESVDFLVNRQKAGTDQGVDTICSWLRTETRINIGSYK